MPRLFGDGSAVAPSKRSDRFVVVVRTRRAAALRAANAAAMRRVHLASVRPQT